MNRLVVTPQAAADLEAIGDYIAEDNAAAALRTIDRLEEMSKLIRDYPGIGATRDEIAKGVRIFPVGSYLILYRYRAKCVEIVRYVHGARRLAGMVEP